MLCTAAAMAGSLAIVAGTQRHGYWDDGQIHGFFMLDRSLQ